MHTPNTLNIVVFFIYQGLFKNQGVTLGRWIAPLGCM